MEDKAEYRKLTDVVTGRKFYMKVESETPEQIVKSQLPYIGRVLFEQMEDDHPEMLKEKMKNPALFVAEMWRLSEIYTNKASSLIDCGMNYLEAMAEARQTVVAIVGL
jgi:hypothetical protein